MADWIFADIRDFRRFRAWLCASLRLQRLARCDALKQFLQVILGALLLLSRLAQRFGRVAVIAFKLLIRQLRARRLIIRLRRIIFLRRLRRADIFVALDRRLWRARWRLISRTLIRRRI